MSGALVAKTVQLQRRQEEERYMMANGAFSKFSICYIMMSALMDAHALYSTHVS